MTQCYEAPANRHLPEEVGDHVGVGPYGQVMLTHKEFVDIGHTRVAYSRTGSGPDVLFIHGWPLNGTTWRHVVPEMDGYTSWVIDLPGAGSSRATEETPLTMPGHVETVVKIIDELGLSDVVLVGQDSGGMIARYAAEKRPAAVRALSLCGTEIPGHHPPLVRFFTFAGRLPAAAASFKFLMGNRTIARTPLILGGTVADKSLLDGEMRDTLLDPILADDAAMASAIKLIRNFSKADVDPLAQTHPNLTMPALLVWGEDDPFFPVDKARAMAEQFAGPTQFEVLPDTKLLVHEERPHEFAALTRTFLEAHI